MIDRLMDGPKIRAVSVGDARARRMLPTLLGPANNGRYVPAFMGMA